MYCEIFVRGFEVGYLNSALRLCSLSKNGVDSGMKERRCQILRRPKESGRYFRKIQEDPGRIWTLSSEG